MVTRYQYLVIVNVITMVIYLCAWLFFSTVLCQNKMNTYKTVHGDIEPAVR